MSTIIMHMEHCTGRMMERLEPSGWTRKAMEDIFVRFDGGFAKWQIVVCFYGEVSCAESARLSVS